MQNKWTKSSFSDTGHCVEVKFKKSSFCGEAGCVEVGHEDEWVLVRNSNKLELGTWTFSKKVWAKHIEFIKEHETETVSSTGFEYMLEVSHAYGMEFTNEEIEAFVKGVMAGEFDLEETK